VPSPCPKKSNYFLNFLLLLLLCLVWCQEFFKNRNLFGAKAPAHSEKRKKNRPTLVQTLLPEG